MALEWYLLRVEPQGEFQVARALTLRGREVYIPRITRQKTRNIHKELPLFPGYLFIRLDWDLGDWTEIKEQSHIIGWVNFDGLVPSISDDQMAELSAQVDSMNGENGLWRRFKVGEPVRVDAGSFQGLAEVIEEAKSSTSKALVLMEFMGRIAQIRVPWMNLEPCSSEELYQSQKPRIPRRTRGKGRWIDKIGVLNH